MKKFVPQQGEHSGRLVIPANHSYDKPGGPHYGKFGFGAHLLISDNHGETWRRSEPIRPEMNESQVVELSDGNGTLVMNMRSYHDEHSRGRATSTDGGATWTPVTHDHQLVESRCQASIFHYGPYNGKQLVLFSSPAVPVGRTHMTIRVSVDNAQSWSYATLIHEGPSAYSSLARLPNGEVGLFFEAGDESPYETMRFISIPVSELLPESFNN
ncbi:MAG: sialidase family protein [Balneolaceae bacterium]|nr:sialidase family protein [Balneolaceae bacterium]